MRTTFVSLPVILFSALGMAILAIIITVAFFSPTEVRQSEIGSPVDIIEATTEPPGDPVDIIEAATALPITANVEFTLQTVTNNGRYAYIGIGGEIDGIINPDLVVDPDDVVRLILVNGDGMPHDLILPDFDAKLPYVSKIGDQVEVIFAVDDMQPDSYVYYCTVPGHRQLGQEGKLVVSEPLEY